jgi:hypothetical protein
LADPELELNRIEKKTRKEKTWLIRRVNLARSGQKPGYNLLFLFLLKQCYFDFFKKQIYPVIRCSGQNSKSGS